MGSAAEGGAELRDAAASTVTAVMSSRILLTPPLALSRVRLSLRGPPLGSWLVRAVLIVNPNATSTTPAGRDLLAHALESRVELTVTHTERGGHAVDRRAAKRDGID